MFTLKGVKLTPHSERSLFSIALFTSVPIFFGEEVGVHSPFTGLDPPAVPNVVKGCDLGEVNTEGATVGLLGGEVEVNTEGEPLVSLTISPFGRMTYPAGRANPRGDVPYDPVAGGGRENFVG